MITYNWAKKETNNPKQRTKHETTKKKRKSMVQRFTISQQVCYSKQVEKDIIFGPNLVINQVIAKETTLREL
jgi:hypothetical protein